MEAAEIVEGMVSYSMEALKDQARALCAAHGLYPSDDDLNRKLAPIRHHVAVMCADNVEAVRGL